MSFPIFDEKTENIHFVQFPFVIILDQKSITHPDYSLVNPVFVDVVGPFYLTAIGEKLMFNHYL